MSAESRKRARQERAAQPAAVRPCIVCGSPTDHARKPTYENRLTAVRYAITPDPVWVCDGCTYEAANYLGRYVDEREGR